MQDLLEKYTTLETQVKMAKEALDLANSRYKLGVVRNIEVFDAQTNLTLIELTRLQYEFQLSQSWIDIKRLTGVKIN
jgi:outer membrane protein TolC